MEPHQDSDSKTEISRAAECVSVFLSGYRGPEKEQIPFVLLSALAKETAARIDECVPLERVTFDAQELAKLCREAAAIQGPKKGKESSWVSKNWAALERLLLETETSLVSLAREKGFQHLPRLDKQQSKGGSGQRSQYRLLARLLPEASHETRYKVPFGGLRYTIERRRKVPWTLWLYVSRRFRTIRRAVLLTIMALFLLGWLVLWVPLILKAFVPVEVDYFAILFGSSMLALGYFLFFGPLFSVNDWRVAALPFLFQPSDEHEPLLLQEFRPPGDTESRRQIDLVKYTGNCPVCGDRVVVGSGGLRFWGRLVGRCRSSPREHVFSFDHVTLVGRALIRNPAPQAKPT